MYAYMHTVDLQLGIFVGLLTMGLRVSLTHLPGCGTFFFSFCVALSSFNFKVYAYSYYILLCQIWLISLESCSFLKGYGGVIDLEERMLAGELGGEEKRKAAVGVYCMVEEKIIK